MADTDSESSNTKCGVMPESEHTNNLMKGIPQDDDWRVFTLLKNKKFDSLADKEQMVHNAMKTLEVWHQKEVSSEVAVIYARLKMKRE